MGYCPSGGNPTTIKKYVALWGIDVSHFDPGRVSTDALRRANPPRPIEELLTERSSVTRAYLKRRLYTEGIKEPRCELCGQGEIWRGVPITLILDHINGVRDDNRLENLRIVCPNCAATLPTHCGRTLKKPVSLRQCDHCGAAFRPSQSRQRFCSRRCAGRVKRKQYRGLPRPESRKVQRPPYEQLIDEIEDSSFLAVGRKYGVSDNAVRKWLRWYELEREREAQEHASDDEAA